MHVDSVYLSTKILACVVAFRLEILVYWDKDEHIWDNIRLCFDQMVSKCPALPLKLEENVVCPMGTIKVFIATQPC